MKSILSKQICERSNQKSITMNEFLIKLVRPKNPFNVLTKVDGGHCNMTLNCKAIVPQARIQVHRDQLNENQPKRCDPG